MEIEKLGLGLWEGGREKRKGEGERLGRAGLQFSILILVES